MKKIGFVVPWYHKDIRGGAEQELRGIVTHLKANNVDLEIITTCVKEFTADWTENYFKEGVEIVDGIPIRRFKVRKGNMKEFHRINAKVMQGKTISYDEEDIFIREMVLICMIISGSIVRNIIDMCLFHICLVQLIMGYWRVHLSQFLFRACTMRHTLISDIIERHSGI